MKTLLDLEFLEEPRTSNAKSCFKAEVFLSASSFACCFLEAEAGTETAPRFEGHSGTSGSPTLAVLARILASEENHTNPDGLLLLP